MCYSLYLWPETDPVKIATMSVHLSEMPEEIFRLFENHRLVFER